MSQIRLTRRHGLALGAAKAVAQEAADELAQQYDLESAWEGDTLHFSRSGVDGYMQVTSSEIDLTVKLGLLLRPFRAAFEENIEKNLDKLLTAARKRETSTAGSRPKPATAKVAKAGKSKASGRKA